MAVSRNNNFGLFVSQSYIIILRGGALAAGYIRAVDSRQSSTGLSPDWGHYIVFLGKAICSNNALSTQV